LSAALAAPTPASLARAPAPPGQGPNDGNAPTDLDAQTLARDLTTLVLPGGGARGAYEAGAIEGIRQRAGIVDGVPLPGISAVLGTSIGSINGWFVATAQYSLLAALWYGIASEAIFRIKKRYAATVTPSSGLITRIVEAALISQGLTSNVTGILDGRRVLDWLHRHIDPAVPIVMTYAFTATNLEQQRSEIFFRTRAELTARTRAATADRVREILGRSITARPISNEHLALALAGSSAIPILFDPVTITFSDGPRTYIDGGVADSAPVDFARVVAKRVQLILVDPARPDPRTYPNAAAIGTAAFGIAQNRVLESSLRSAFFETRGKRLFENAATTPAQRDFLASTYDVDIEIMRPAAELPVDVPGFDDAQAIAATYELGREAGLSGFRPYVPEDLSSPRV
jgi:predicted acylesterase/phospholipase RssA